MSVLTRKSATPGAAQDVLVPDERPLPGFVRVNLLPRSIKERGKVGRAKRIVMALIALVFLAVAGLWFLTQQQIQEQEKLLAEAQATGLQLQQQSAQYAEVPQVFAQAETANAALNSAMGGQIRWAFLLNQLSFATPPGVTLEGIGGVMSETGVAPTSPGGVLPPKESVGTMTFTGTSSSFQEVASWLDSLDGLKDYTYPFLSNSQKAEDGVINWGSTADLSVNSLSGAYGTAPVGTAPPGGAQSAPAPTPPSDGAASDGAVEELGS